MVNEQWCEMGTIFLFPLHETFYFDSYRVVGRGSSVGIATRYVLDGPGIEFQ